MAARYVGRFAPSPSGPLHFGSLATALASFVDARQHGGQWLLRIEDIDPPREVDGATDEIIASLHRHGLQWDGEIMLQNKRSDMYDAALAWLDRAGHLYACDCTRKQLRAYADDPNASFRCPQNCQSRRLPLADNPLRVSVPAGCFTAHDLVRGDQTACVADDPGDFLVRRRGGLYAYQLAVVVDDHLQGVNHVVRGADLLDNSPRQVALAALLGYRAPDYLHLPLALDSDGRKLSKQTGAPAVDDDNALNNLLAAWRFLGQEVPTAEPQTPAEFLGIAESSWSRARLPATNHAFCC